MAWQERRSALTEARQTNPHLLDEAGVEYWRQIGASDDWRYPASGIADLVHTETEDGSDGSSAILLDVYAASHWHDGLAYTRAPGEILISWDWWSTLGHDWAAMVVFLAEARKMATESGLRKLDTSHHLYRRAVMRAALVKHALTTDRVTALEDSIAQLYRDRRRVTPERVAELSAAHWELRTQLMGMEGLLAILKEALPGREDAPQGPVAPRADAVDTQDATGAQRVDCYECESEGTNCLGHSISAQDRRSNLPGD